MLNTSSIREQCIDIASSLRLGKNIEISEQIVALSHQFSSVAASLTPQQLSSLQAILGQTLACQERQDWLAMADYLEYELIEYLASL